MDVAVYDTAIAASEGEFEGGLYTGTLENDGVAIAPFHENEERVPAEVQDAVDDLREQIIAGEIETRPAG
jgi:basic membrane protein A